MSFFLETSRASVAERPLSSSIRIFPVSATPDDGAWLRVEASGVCGTDWEFYERCFGADLGPLVLGHEVVGRIASIGERAERRWGVSEGARVVVEEFIPCGTCQLCRLGNYRLCQRTEFRGSGPFLRYGATPISLEPSLWGGFSEMMYLHPDSVLHPFPDNIACELATLFVPISNGIRWVTQEATPQIGGTAVIMGPGQHGLGCVIAAKESGYQRIIVMGLSRDETRLELATRLGATDILMADRTETVGHVMDITNGLGADLVVDVVPESPTTVTQAVKMVRKCGEVIIAATKRGGGDLSETASELLKKSATLRGVRGHDIRSVRPAIKLIESERYPLQSMCTHIFNIDDADLALRTAHSGHDGAVHVVVKPDA